MTRYGLIQTAFPQEFQAVARASEGGSIRRLSAYEIRCGLAGKDCRLIQSGIGQRRTRLNLSRWLRDNAHPAWIMSIGFAGALSPKLGVGGCLVAANVISAASNESLSPTTAARFPEDDSDWITDRGDLITLLRPALDREAKEQYFRQYGASGCDLETFAVARIAQDVNIPWISVRVISDTSDEQIPRWMLTLGRLTQRRQTLPAARLVVARFHQLPKLVRLGLRMQRLQASLSKIALKALMLADR